MSRNFLDCNKHVIDLIDLRHKFVCRNVTVFIYISSEAVPFLHHFCILHCLAADVFDLASRRSMPLLARPSCMHTEKWLYKLKMVEAKWWARMWWWKCYLFSNESRRMKFKKINIRCRSMFADNKRVPQTNKETIIFYTICKLLAKNK